MEPMFEQIFGRFLRPFGQPPADQKVSHDIYGAVVAQSRQPVFYLDYGLADTVMGRFDLLCLHMFLFTNRLARENDPVASKLSQAVFDAFSADIDRALREIGIGDTSVPKRKKRMIHGFYGQIEDFAAALDAGDTPTLALKVTERFSDADSAQAGRLARYMVAARDTLRAIPFSAIADGRIEWPDAERNH
jgi:cytochrome b pre-mRNA-processing protein 3